MDLPGTSFFDDPPGTLGVSVSDPDRSSPLVCPAPKVFEGRRCQGRLPDVSLPFLPQCVDTGGSSNESNDLRIYLYGSTSYVRRVGKEDGTEEETVGCGRTIPSVFGIRPDKGPVKEGVPGGTRPPSVGPR